MEPVVVEVKSLLKSGVSLFGHMMKTVDALKPGQSLIVKSTFNPRPLIGHMKRRGYQVTQERIGKQYVTTFRPGEPVVQGGAAQDGRPDRPIEGPEHYLDNRGLLPPEPMQRTLALLQEVPEGHVVVIHNDRVPVFLLGQLDDEQIPYEIIPQADESAVVRILKTHDLSV